MKPIIVRLLLCTALITLFAQFSSQDSVGSTCKPSVNFYGTITDDSQKTYDVDNITISGLYKQIPVYSMPPKSTMNPERNTTRIDLAEIQEIKVPHQDGAAKVHSFANRHYVEIVVISTDTKTPETYLIERSRKLRCDKMNPANSSSDEKGAVAIETEIAIEALDTLVIKGYKQRELESSHQKR